jgi:hypothetical protein
MAYVDVWTMTFSETLRGRCTAAAAQEQTSGATLDPADPDEWVDAHIWTLAAAPGWSDAWASAVASGNPDPGRDEAVISDPMILSEVQAVLAG